MTDAMKTYTIRTFRWVRSTNGAYVAKTPIGYYHVDKDDGGVEVSLETFYDTRHLSTSKSIAAAKKLAWQDWLLRITPALEEVK